MTKKHEPGMAYDMKKLNKLYEKLEWDHRDYLEFTIEGNHITIRNKSREGR